MSTPPAVTVVICFLDAERFLGEALESVFAQTSADWELVLVDDGSRDGSEQIAEAARSKHPDRVRLLAHPERENRGISASRNLGLAAARGRFVAFLDADDVWLPEKLERQVAYLEALPEVGMTYGPSELWYGWTGRRSDARRDTGMPGGSVVEPPGLLVHLLRSGGAFVPGIGSLLVRREVALADGFEEDFRDLFEDQAFLAKVLLRHRVLITDDCTQRYRQHGDSVCARAEARGEYDPARPNPARGRYLRGRSARVEAVGCDDPGLRRARRRELRPYGPALTRWPWTALPRFAQAAKAVSKQLAQRLLPAALLRYVKARLRGRAYVPPPGWVRFGSLRRLAPLSREFGYDRGLPVDRHYLEDFLARHAADVRGRTLEVGDDAYTRQFGGGDVVRADVLHFTPGAPGATFVTDLADPGEVLPENAFDCIVLTQTLQLIYDVRAAVATVQRILRPGGVVLATLPGISQLSEDEWRAHWCWGFTELSARRLFESAFPSEAVEVESFGNVLAATAFLQGMASEEFRARELAHRDPAYPLVITVRARKPGLLAAPPRLESGTGDSSS